MKIETLHLCNLEEEIDIKNYVSLVSKKDRIVFYGSQINQNTYETLLEKFYETPIYFVLNKKTANYKVVSHKKWLALVSKAKRTMTWK